MRVHDSHSYRKMDVTRERISRILELKEILLSFQTARKLTRLQPVWNDRSTKKLKSQPKKKKKKLHCHGIALIVDRFAAAEAWRRLETRERKAGGVRPRDECLRDLGQGC